MKARWKDTFTYVSVGFVAGLIGVLGAVVLFNAFWLIFYLAIHVGDLLKPCGPWSLG